MKKETLEKANDLSNKIADVAQDIECISYATCRIGYETHDSDDPCIYRPFNVDIRKQVSIALARVKSELEKEFDQL